MHAVLAASAVPLFLGALLSDWAYASTDHVQWTNFAAWLIAGGLVVAGLALVWGAIDLLRARRVGQRRAALYVALMLASVVLGFVNALVHARDAWAAMPSGLVLSAVVLTLAGAASGLGLQALRRGGQP